MEPRNDPASGPSTAITALIVAQGLATVVASFLFLPVGGALVLVNVVGAVATRGGCRGLFATFATFAIAGAIALLCVLVFGFQMSVSQEVSVVEQ